MKQSCACILSVDKIMLNDRYLDLPLFVGRSNNQFFQGIKDCLVKLIRGQKNKLLSPTGKAVFIQSVAQAIPLNHMYYYKLSKDFLNDLNMVLARFLCGGDETKRKIHWKHWDTLFTSPYFQIFALQIKGFWRILLRVLSL